MHVIVLGCGVSGLSCGIRLLEAGHTVELRARELPPRTTSDIAAAIWYPYLVAPRERVADWSLRTLEVLRGLAARPESGVRWVRGLEVLGEPSPEPWWSPHVSGFRHATAEELLPGYGDGFVFEAPIVEMPRYLPFLMARLGELGGTVVRREVRSLEEAWAVTPVVVNCTGLGARELVGDGELFPIRGEVLRVAPLPEPRFLLDDTRGMAYVIPRSGDCILGGTAEEGNSSLVPDPAQAEAILKRAERLLPEGTRLQVLQHLVGLRPGRSSVRLEEERRGERRVIHDYGHGGSGITLSWGCAEEVVALVEQGDESRVG
jgi:D-amino-acid oxidase